MLVWCSVTQRSPFLKTRPGKRLFRFTSDLALENFIRMFVRKMRKSGLLYRRRAKIEQQEAMVEEIEYLEPYASNDEQETLHGDVAEVVYESSSEEENYSDPGDTEDSADDDKDAPEYETMPVDDCLRHWALSTNQTHRALSQLLKIWNAKNKTNLPKSAKTLLRTRRIKNNILSIAGGQYWYYGIRNCFRNYFCRKSPSLSSISINISMDGLPLHRSSTTQFWPIQMNIHEMPTVPVMTLAIFCGKTKPNNVEEYLRPFVDELDDIMKNGINLPDGKKLEVAVRAIIADSPARSFVKGVAYFNAKSGCHKCTVKGEYSNESHTVIFKSTRATRRNDQAFRAMLYGEHHRTYTPLLDITSFDMVRDVVVSDRLHLVDLGVMRRMLFGWRDGTLGIRTKWSNSDCGKVSNMLDNLELPSEIHRAQRGLEFLSNWKGSEYASFLHYASIVVLKAVLSDEAYDHFLLLFCSITMLSSKMYKANWHVAGVMLEDFVNKFGRLYGEKFLTSNVHNLIHVYDEVLHFGSLETLSSYPFENNLQFLKSLLRGVSRCLAQAVNRLSELEKFNYYKGRSTKPCIMKNNKHNELRFNDNFILQNNDRNGWLLTRDKLIVRYSFALQPKQRTVTHMKGKILAITKEFFYFPFRSSVLDIYQGNISNLSVENRTIACSNVKCKLVAIKCENHGEFVFIPLVHTIT